MSKPTNAEKSSCLHKFYFDGDFVAQSVYNILGTTAYDDFKDSLSKILSDTGTINNRFADVVINVCKDKAKKFGSKTTFKILSERLKDAKIGADFEIMCSKLLE